MTSFQDTGPYSSTDLVDLTGEHKCRVLMQAGQGNPRRVCGNDAETCNRSNHRTIVTDDTRRGEAGWYVRVLNSRGGVDGHADKQVFSEEEYRVLLTQELEEQAAALADLGDPTGTPGASTHVAFHPEGNTPAEDPGPDGRKDDKEDKGEEVHPGDEGAEGPPDPGAPGRNAREPEERGENGPEPRAHARVIREGLTDPPEPEPDPKTMPGGLAGCPPTPGGPTPVAGGRGERADRTPPPRLTPDPTRDLYPGTDDTGVEDVKPMSWYGLESDKTGDRTITMSRDEAAFLSTIGWGVRRLFDTKGGAMAWSRGHDNTVPFSPPARTPVEATPATASYAPPPSTRPSRGGGGHLRHGTPPTRGPFHRAEQGRRGRTQRQRVRTEEAFLRPT